TSPARALLGAIPAPVAGDDSQYIETNSAAAATVITGVHDVNVKSTATINHYIADGAFSVSGIVGLGVALASDTITSQGEAIVGAFTQIGAPGSAIAGALNVDAHHTITVNPFDTGSPIGISIGGGAILGAAGGIGLITVTDGVTARIGDQAQIYATGDINDKATGTLTGSQMDIDGGAVGGFAVGFVIAHTTFKPTVSASVGKG